MTDIEGTIKLKCFKCGTILDKSEVKMDSHAGLYHEDCRRDIEEATSITAENLGCTPEQLDNAINHFKKIEEAEANRPKEKLDEIIESLESLRAWTRYVPSAVFHDRFTAILIALHEFKEEEL